MGHARWGLTGINALVRRGSRIAPPVPLSPERAVCSKKTAQSTNLTPSGATETLMPLFRVCYVVRRPSGRWTSVAPRHPEVRHGPRPRCTGTVGHEHHSRPSTPESYRPALFRARAARPVRTSSARAAGPGAARLHTVMRTVELALWNVGRGCGRVFAPLLEMRAGSPSRDLLTVRTVR